MECTAYELGTSKPRVLVVACERVRDIASAIYSALRERELSVEIGDAECGSPAPLDYDGVVFGWPADRVHDEALDDYLDSFRPALVGVPTAILSARPVNARA